ncbi:MAG: ABC transporter permease [Spirochaetaceae bacterium]
MKPDWMLFVSRRHFRTKRREKGHTASLLSVTGIAAGVMTLVAVLAVMNGFQHGTIESILELNSYHLRISGLDERGAAVGGAGGRQEAPGPAERLEGVTGVEAAVPFRELQTLARGRYSGPEAVVLRAVPPEVLERDRGFAESIEVVAGRFDLESPRSVVIGAELARVLGIGIGDRVSVVDLAGDELDVADPTEIELVVRGLFRSGFLDYDSSWGFVSLEEAGRVFGDAGEVTWGLKLANRFNDRPAASRVARLIPGDASVNSWREFNRSIFGALRLEKTLMMLLVGLIFVVVGVNIYQSLRRSVVERTEEIAVLKALGAPPGSVRAVFTLEGFMIGLLGGVVGVALGLLVSENVNELFAFAEGVVNTTVTVLQTIGGAVGEGEFTLFSPAYFYIEEVPTRAVLSETIGIFLFAVVSATAAAYGASFRVARIKPAEVLRNE